MSSQADTTLWVTRCAVPTASSLALDDGLLGRALRSRGVAAGILGEGIGRELDPAHYDHGRARLLREGGNVPALWARSRGARTRLVGLTWVDELQAVVALGDDGPRTAADLRGARLGVLRDTTRPIDHLAAMALHGHRSALATAGLELGDAHVVELERPLAAHRPASRQVAALPRQWRRDAEALLTGEVDAIYVKGAPGRATIDALGLRVVCSLGDHPDPLVRVNNGTPRTITVGAELAEEVDLLAAALGALLDAADAAAADPAALHARVAADTGTGAEAAAAAYGTVRLHPRLDDGALAGLARQASFLGEHDFLDGPVDLHAWVDPEPLRRALAARGGTPTAPTGGSKTP